MTRPAAQGVPLTTGATDPTPSPVVVPGGELDRNFPGVDVFVGIPQAATPPAGTACLLAKKYIDTVNAGMFDKMVDLFEDDAFVLDPMRHNSYGRAQIDAFYKGRISGIRPELIVVAYVGGESDCMAVIAGRGNVQGQSRFRLIAIDHFTKGKTGKIGGVVAYARPTVVEGHDEPDVPVRPQG